MTARRGAWPAAVAIAAALLATSVLGAEVRYGVAALLLLAVVFGALGALLAHLLALGQRLGRLAAGLAAFAVAFTLVFHLRELTYWPSSLSAVPLVAIVAAPPLAWATRGLGVETPVGRRLFWLSASLVVFLAAIHGTYRGSNLLRWHLLRHNTMLGTPVYYTLGPRVEALEEALFARHRGKAAPPSAAAEIVRETIEIEGEAHDSPANLGAAPAAVPAAADVVDAASEQPAREGAPHLVFVLLDTLRADALAPNRPAGETPMPRLDAYLADAWRFSDLIASSSWTRPSMASFFTGLTQEEHGARDVGDPLEERYETLAERLAGLGYETAAFVTNVGAVGRDAGFSQGFDFFYELDSTPYARAGEVGRTVRRWLAERDDQRPLFLWLHYLDPHEPYLSGEAPRRKSPAEYRRAYAAELAYLDGELTALLADLDELLAGERAVFVTSDHGEELGEHGLYGHGLSLYDEVIAIPAALHTGRGAGILDARLEGRDVFELLVEVATSRGALSVEEWAAERHRESRYASIYYSSSGRLQLRPYQAEVCMRSVERDGEKLVWSAYGDTVELYDLSTDPSERDNLADRRPLDVERLQRELEAAVEGAWAFPPPYEPSGEALEQLEALGYVK